ncbi:MAG: IS4 family transposase, partial [Okeania sp. SIO2H7]|nr:IS4 family transposase [Okeania sp. SIO2H7]
MRQEVFCHVSREELGFFPLDSTSITLTSKLFHELGYSQVKLFAGQDLSSGSIEGVKVNFGSGHDSKYGNETVNAIPYNSVGIMDRGFASCERIQELLKVKDRFFLIRIKKKFSLKMLNNGNFKIGQKDKECEARVVSFCDLATQEEYRLVTNLPDDDFKGFSNYEIAEIYKRRWQIELLWKFLKMHLKLDKLITKNLNGVTIQIYACLIAYLILKLVRVTPEFDDIAVPSLVRYKILGFREQEGTGNREENLILTEINVFFVKINPSRPRPRLPKSKMYLINSRIAI